MRNTKMECNRRLPVTSTYAKRGIYHLVIAHASSERAYVAGMKDGKYNDQLEAVNCCKEALDGHQAAEMLVESPYGLKGVQIACRIRNETRIAV